MSKKQEPVTVTVKRIELDNVTLEGLGPLDVNALAREIENKMDQISKEKHTMDTFKVLLHTALFYAAKAYTKSNNEEQKNKAGEKQLDSAIEKLTLALNRLPLK